MIIFRYLVPSLFMVIGIMLLVEAYQHWNKSYRLVSGYVSAPGEIIEVVPHVAVGSIGKSTSLHYFPDVKYTTVKGEEVIFRSQAISKADHYRAGDTVEVLYDEADPQQAVINSFSALWVVALIFGTSGVLVILFSSWFFRHAYEDQKKGDGGK